MGVKVKEWKGAWWVFINHQGHRKAKRCASKKAATLAADYPLVRARYRSLLPSPPG